MTILWISYKNRLVMKQKTLKPFWRTKKNGDITFKPISFNKFLSTLGFVVNESGLILKIVKTNNSIYPVNSWIDIHTYVTKFLMRTNEEHFEEDGKFGVEIKPNEDETWEQDEVLDHWMVKGQNICKMVFDSREMFPKFKMSQIFRDTDKECYLNFRNGIVKITKDKIEFLDDTSVIGNKYRFTSQFIDKLDSHKTTSWNGKVEVNNNTDGEFEMFVKSSTSTKVNELENYEFGVPKYGREYVFNEEGYKSLMSGIGFLLHGKSLGGISKMVLLQDRYIDGVTRQGGNGKSIIMRGVEKVVKMYESEGIKIDKKNRFKYQGVNLGDKVFFIDELRPSKGPVSGGIQIHDLFTDITSSFKIEKKNQNELTLSGDDVPKLVGCSNYIVFEKDDSSTMRRIHIVEFSDLGKHFPGNINQGWNSKKKMLGYEGHWNNKDWNDFYNFMFRCVQLWLKTKPDFHSEPNPRWKTSSQFPKFIKKYGQQECQWGVNYLRTDRVEKKHYILKDGKGDKTNGTMCFSHNLYQDFDKKCPDSYMTETEMKKMLFDMCKDMGFEYNPTMKGNGDSPNLRKLQKTYFIDGIGLKPQKQVIHITHPSDPV